MNWQAAQRRFYKKLAGDCPSTCFNPWKDQDPRHDRAGAARMRRSNLELYMERFAPDARTLVLGEAPGYAGCRFTGLPFTHESHLASPQFWPFIPHRRTSSRERVFREPSGTILRSVFDEARDGLLVWNALPWHPHAPGKPLSNRPPRKGELRVGLAVLETLVKGLPRLEQIAAVGRAAETLAHELGGFPVVYLRHPSRGGGPEFRAGAQKLRRSRR